jgi:hypothetical protein
LPKKAINISRNLFNIVLKYIIINKDTSIFNQALNNLIRKTYDFSIFPDKRGDFILYYLIARKINDVAR